MTITPTFTFAVEGVRPGEPVLVSTLATSQCAKDAAGAAIEAVYRSGKAGNLDPGEIVRHGVTRFLVMDAMPGPQLDALLQHISTETGRTEDEIQVLFLDRLEDVVAAGIVPQEEVDDVPAEHDVVIGGFGSHPAE
ncbi:hypothetical protein DWF04_015375 [Cereibacter sphaeroides f. sp. denitrificans]|nr:hypothetical protein DWF04_16550 [Cereibacter sphaeroides f. sp. denitrificans]